MPVPDILRDSFVGQLVYYGSGRKYFQYPEDRPDFQLPEKYLGTIVTQRPVSEVDDKKARYSITEVPADGSEEQGPPQESSLGREFLHPSHPHHTQDPEKGEPPSEQSVEEAGPETIIVDWYGPHDPECPANWSLLKRSFVTFDICLITFSMYVGSALFAPGIPDMAEKFGISQVAASLGLTMFVVGYGTGPMFLSPLSEIPQFGRAPVYMITLIIFIILQVPTALAKNLGTVASLRFLAGFIGSPPMATGAASMADLWPPEHLAAFIAMWGLAAMTGPAVGPILGGFSAQAKGWTWTIWILMWLASTSAVFLAFLMPETSSQAILYRRAVRLRRITGNRNLRSQGEVDAQHMTLGDIATMTLVRPFVLGFTEPIVIFWNSYLALAYGILYCFISAFPVVFVEKHGFNLGEGGLAFSGILLGDVLSVVGFFIPWLILTLQPKIRNGTFVPEDRMPVGMYGAFMMPIGMFWFGWTSGANIHWISPILASGVWAAGAFLLFQAGLNYLADCYPRYVASVMAGNDFFRSMLGASFPLYSTAFFHNLRVGPACSVLGGISILMLPIPFVLYRYGARIRAYSKYAD